MEVKEAVDASPYALRHQTIRRCVPHLALSHPQGGAEGADKYIPSTKVAHRRFESYPDCSSNILHIKQATVPLTSIRHTQQAIDTFHKP